jgi:phage terminase large subunit-like protein
MPWKSKSKDDDIKEIYKQRGQTELGKQEMSGETIDALTFIVRPIYIRQLQERAPYIFERPPGVIHVAIDPHGGGKTSNTAIMMLANENGRIVVCHRRVYNERISYTKSIVSTYFF